VIALLNLKKKEINASEIYSPVGRFAERAKYIKYFWWLWFCSRLDYGGKEEWEKGSLARLPVRR